MGGKFQKGDKILYGQDWEKRGIVDFVLDLGKEQYQYAITLKEELQAITTNDLKSGNEPKGQWKKLNPPETLDKVMEHRLKAA